MTNGLVTTPEMLAAHWKANWELLMKECANLQAENERLTAENKKLREELAELKRYEILRNN